jgi:hypothetical protein
MVCVPMVCVPMVCVSQKFFDEYFDFSEEYF